MIQAYRLDMSPSQVGMREILEAIAQLTGNMEQRARDQEAEDAAIWTLPGVDSEEVDNEVIDGRDITLPLIHSQRQRCCK